MRVSSLLLSVYCILSLSLGSLAVAPFTPRTYAQNTVPVPPGSATPTLPQAAPSQPGGLVAEYTTQASETTIPRTYKPLTLDGVCRPSEYGDGAQIWMNSRHTMFVNAIFGKDGLYICTNVLFGPAGSDSIFIVYINRDGQPRTAPGPADLRYQATPDGQFAVSIGNGTGYTGAIPTLAATTIITGDEWDFQDDLPPLETPWWADEFRIPLPELAPYKFGELMHIAIHYKGFVADPTLGGLPWDELLNGDWPAGFNAQQPSSWGTLLTQGHDLFLPLMSRSSESLKQAVGSSKATTVPPIGVAIHGAPKLAVSAQQVQTQARSQPTSGDFDDACPDWKTPLYAFDREAKWPKVDPDTNPIVQGQGTLNDIHVSAEDSPFIHDSHDVDMKMTPYPDSNWLMLAGHSQLVLETESRGFLSYARPMPGDHVTVVGRWIFDCGHEAKTEVHPIPVFESDRFELRRIQPNAPLQKVRVVRVRMNSDPGAFSYTFNNYAFTFSVELPPGQVKPFIGFVSGEQQFVTTSASANSNFASVTIRAPAPTGQWFWEFILGRNIPANASNLFDTYTVHLDKVDVNDDHDHGFPDCGGIFDPGDCGEWTMNVHMHGAWDGLSMNGSWGTVFDKTTVDEDEGPYDLHIALPVTGEQLGVYVEGYDDDDPFKGDDITHGFWDLGALVDLCCGKQQSFAPGGDWTLFYSVTKDDNRPLPPDQEPPTTEISLPPLPAGGWYLQDVLVTVNASDDISGVEVTQCRINGGDWFIYTLPFSISREGASNTVECFSRDKSGKVESPKTATFNLDKFPPTSGLLVTGQVYGSIGDVTYIGRHHTLALHALDTVFDRTALQVEYRIYKDGAAPGAFSAPSPNGTTFSLPIDTGGVGLWHVDFRAADPVHTFETLPPDAFQTKSFFISARVQDGLVVFYPFSEGANTIVHDYSLNGTPLDLQIGNPSAATWVPGGLTINSPTMLASSLPATKLTKAVSDTDELTLEAWIQPSQPVPEDPASIVTLATDTISRNVTLSQLRSGKPDRVRYDVLLRTSRTSRKGSSLRSDRQILQPVPIHLIYTRDALGLARLYLNGVFVEERHISGKLAAWGDIRLSLANELIGGAPWLGTYRLVAFYNRALSPAEVHQNFLGGPAGNGNMSTPAELQTLYRFNEGSGSIIRDQAGATPALDLQIANPTATSWMTSGLVISTATILSSSAPAIRLTHAVTGTNEVSLEAWVTPAAQQPETLARILTLSNDPMRRNIELLQERAEGRAEAHFTVRTRTTETESSAKPPLETPNNSVQLMLQHVVFTRDALGLERIYINGVKVADRTFGGDFSTWDGSYRLALGNTLANDRSWLGAYHQVAIYNRALSPGEISQHYLSGTGH